MEPNAKAASVDSKCHLEGLSALQFATHQDAIYAQQILQSAYNASQGINWRELSARTISVWSLTASLAHPQRFAPLVLLIMLMIRLRLHASQLAKMFNQTAWYAHQPQFAPPVDRATKWLAIQPFNANHYAVFLIAISVLLKHSA